MARGCHTVQLQIYNCSFPVTGALHKGMPANQRSPAPLLNTFKHLVLLSSKSKCPTRQAMSNVVGYSTIIGSAMCIHSKYAGNHWPADDTDILKPHAAPVSLIMCVCTCRLWCKHWQQSVLKAQAASEVFQWNFQPEAAESFSNSICKRTWGISAHESTCWA